MTKQALSVRKRYCSKKNLCFISLKPRTSEAFPLDHSEVGVVWVLSKYL